MASIELLLRAATLKPKLFLWAITASLAGFLFGFDTVVISGAERTIQSLWSLGNLTHGLAMSMALWGTVAGSLAGGWPTDRFGRQKTLAGIGILYLVSAIWSALATDPYSFMIARFIGGVGVGISTIAAPLYISEIAPPEKRGRLSGMFQFNIVFGILIAFLSNTLLSSLGDNAWRWMLGIEALPALIYTAGCLTLPESPRWLISYRGDRERGIETLRKLNPLEDASAIQRLADSIALHSGTSPRSKTSGFWTWRLRVPICLAFLVAFFNQLSGINAILYFAPRIFSLTGLSQQAALLQSVGIGITNLLFTFIGLYLIDRLGRKTLLLIGSVGYILSLGICSLTFFANQADFQISAAAIGVLESAERVNAESNFQDTRAADQLTFETKANELLAALQTNQIAAPGSAEQTPPLKSIREWIELASVAKETAGKSSGSAGVTVLVCIFAFIAAHAVGQGAVIWVLISEIFPNRYRASGQALGSFTHWIFAALLTFSFPTMVNLLSPGLVFGFFCCMMILQLAWVIFFVPETKGVSLEDLQDQLGIKAEPDA